MDMAHIPVVSPDAPGPTAAKLVPSRNQERLAQPKQNPSGTASECVSPVSSRRTKTPVKSAYARYLPSGEIAAAYTAFSAAFAVILRCCSMGCCGQAMSARDEECLRT